MPILQGKIIYIECPRTYNENLQRIIMQLQIFQVDAFTDKIFGGNPAAVCPLRYWFDREQVSPGDEKRVLHKLEQLQPGALDRSPIVLKDVLDIYLMSKDARMFDLPGRGWYPVTR